MSDVALALAADVLAAYDSGYDPDRALVKAAVKQTLALFAERAPGHSVEVRVPPFAAVQVIEGVRHRRGTPPALVECDPRTWLALATGSLAWAEAISSGRCRASGERSDLGDHLPL